MFFFLGQYFVFWLYRFYQYESHNIALLFLLGHEVIILLLVFLISGQLNSLRKQKKETEDSLFSK